MQKNNRKKNNINETKNKCVPEVKNNIHEVKNKFTPEMLLWNIPLVIITMNSLLTILFGQLWRKIEFLITFEKIILTSYGMSFLIIAIIYLVKKFEILSKLNKIKIEKFGRFISFFDKFFQEGFEKKLQLIIPGIIVTIISTYAYVIQDDIQNYYNERVMLYLNELGYYVSGITEKIVFEAVSISGFDFIKINYIVMYIFYIFSSYYWLFFIASFCILMLKKTEIKKFRLIITLNTAVFGIFMYNSEPTSGQEILLYETNIKENYEIKVKYPLLEKFLKDKTFTIKVQFKDKNINNIELGRVSHYRDEYEFNVIHNDDLYCSLRNYTYSKADKAQIELFDIDAGFERAHKNLSVNVEPVKFLDNMYNLTIDDGSKKIIIKNSYLEYDGSFLRFKKIGSNDQEVSTKVYIRCKDHLYSLYYDQTEVGREKINTFLTTGLDSLFANPKSGVRYKYRGRNINDWNPYKCDQIGKLINSQDFKFNKDRYAFYLQRNIDFGICLNKHPYYEDEIMYDYKKLK